MCSYYTVPVQWKTHNLGCHLLQKATVAKAVTEPRHAVKKAYASKIWKAGEECRRQGIMSTSVLGDPGRMACGGRGRAQEARLSTGHADGVGGRNIQ